MKNNLKNFLITGMVLLAVVMLALFPLMPAAPVLAAPAAQTTIPTMASLPEANCVVDAGTRTCDLWAKSGTLSLPGGTSVTIWGFAASAADPALIPGPLLRALEGETLIVNLYNDLAGQNVSLTLPEQSQIPDTAGTAASGMVTYTYTNLTPGAFLYEAGLTENGPRQVTMGLFGPLVVSTDPAPVEQEVILFLSEVDPAFNAAPDTFVMTRYKPKYWLLNGRAFPQTGAIDANAGSTLRLRYFNVGISSYSMGILGINQQVVAVDGEPLANVHGASLPSVGPGQTLETRLIVPENAQNGALFPIYSGSLIQHNNNQRLTDLRAAFGGMTAYLRVGSTVGAGGQGPVASNIAIDPIKSGGLVDLTLTGTLTDDNTTVMAVEYFIDTIGLDGSGTPVPVSTPAQALPVSMTIAAADLALLSSGNHSLFIHGMDADGNWGAPGSVVFTLDKAGPAVLGATLAPNPTNGSTNVSISATVNDGTTGNSNIAAAEYRLDGGAWMPMTLSTTTATQAGASATILNTTVAAMVEGGHSVEIRAQDEFGNWTATPVLVTLTLDTTFPTLLTGTLTPNSINLGSPLPSTVRLNATLEDQLSGAVQSIIVSAEAFIDTVGSPGTGFALYPSDGLFNEVNESAYYNIPGSRFANLSGGTHYVRVVATDKAGNRGLAGSVPITIIASTVDTTGPTVTNVIASPNPAPANQRTVTLTATATDTASNIANVVWFRGTNPATTTLYNMTPVDGSYNSLVENVRASINIRSWAPGVYQISVRARDVRGNWGPITTILLENR